MLHSSRGWTAPMRTGRTLAALGATPQKKTSFPKGDIQVLLLENIHETAQEIVRGEGFRLEVVSHALKEDELVERIRDVHVLGIRSKTRVTA